MEHEQLPENVNGERTTLPALVYERAPDEFRYVEPVADEPHLRDYLEVLLRHRWTALAFFAAVVAFTLVATLAAVPIYKATTLIEIKAETQKVVAFQDVVAQVEREFYLTQYDMLHSRTLAKRVIDRLKLADEPLFNPPAQRPSVLASVLAWVRSLLTRPATTPGGERATAEQALVDRLLGSLDVAPRRNSYLVDVSFFSPSPSLAAAVANVIAAEYVELALDRRLEAVQKGRAFIERQLGVTKASLERSEEELQAFARSNEIIAVDAKQNIEYQKLQDVNGALTKAQHQRMVKEALYKQVRGDADTAQLSKVETSPVIAALSSELGKKEAERARLSDTFTAEYPELHGLDAQIDALRKQLRAERSTLAATLRADFEAARKQEMLLAEALEAQKKIVNDLNQRGIDYKILKREVDTNRTIYDSLLQRLKEVEVTEGIKASNIQVVDPAEMPRGPYRPRPLSNLLLAVLVGAAGGIGLAFFLEHVDTSLKTPNDVERYLRVGILGALPQIRTRHSNGKDTEVAPELIVAEDPQSMAAEALRTLRTSLFLSTAAGPPQRLLVTSARPEEGKTCVTSNLAIVLAQMGKRVVLVDCDFRRPRIHRIFGLDLHVGATSFLTGNLDLPSAICHTTYGIDVLPSGPVPPNQVELIDSAPMRNLLDELSRRYDFVLLDAPPALGFADVPLLARLGCGVLFVVRAGETPRKAAAQATGHLSRMGVKLLGAVLNRVRGDSGYYGYYGYSGYAHPASTAALELAEEAHPGPSEA